MSSPWPAKVTPVRQVARDFGISEACLHRWLKIADWQDGVEPETSPAGPDQSVELREAHKRIKLLEQEAEVMRCAVGYLSQGVNPK
jgi:transposase